MTALVTINIDRYSVKNLNKCSPMDKNNRPLDPRWVGGGRMRVRYLAETTQGDCCNTVLCAHPSGHAGATTTGRPDSIQIGTPQHQFRPVSVSTNVVPIAPASGDLVSSSANALAFANACRAIRTVQPGCRRRNGLVRGH